MDISELKALPTNELVQLFIDKQAKERQASDAHDKALAEREALKKRLKEVEVIISEVRWQANPAQLNDILYEIGTRISSSEKCKVLGEVLLNTAKIKSDLAPEIDLELEHIPKSAKAQTEVLTMPVLEVSIPVLEVPILVYKADLLRMMNIVFKIWPSVNEIERMIKVLNQRID